MNSTQRLLACLHGQIPDRVPISTYELAGWNSRAWENQEPSYRELMDFIRANTDCLYMVDVPVPNARHQEWPLLAERWSKGDEHFTRQTLRAGSRVLTRLTSSVDSVKTTWVREHWCQDVADLRAILELPWQAGEPNFAELEQSWADLGSTRGLPMISIADALCEVSEYFEFGNFTVLAMTQTDDIVAALDIVHMRRLEELGRILQGPVKNCVFRICGPEYATPPYLPPELFARFVTPYVSQYVEMIHAAGALARIHSHGRIGRVVGEIAKMAPAALDPVEPPPDGDIELSELKKTIGRNVCLMGGVELKHLEAAKPAFIDELVTRIMQQGKPGGRFVIMPTAAPINIPLSPQTCENYIRFIQKAIDLGAY